MFEHLAGFKTIIVTGPHRSGTTICAAMIGRDISATVIREEAFGFKNLRKLLWLIFWTRVARLPIVVQTPAMFHHIRLLGRLPGTAIVLMRRPLAELAEARQRMYGADGSRLSGDEQNAEELRSLGFSEGDAAAIKYDLWERWRDGIRHPFEVSYDELAAHPMWVPAEVRRSQKTKWDNRRIA